MRPSPQAGVAAAAASGDWHARLLVVDDNAATRYQVVRVLSEEGYEIIEGSNGQEALRAATEQSPDLVILDVKMPDMLGFEVTERLRANPATAHLGIMHISATYTGADAQAFGLGKGADAYLTHPVEPQVLIATVRSLLRIQQYERQLVDLLEREASARNQAEKALAIAERVEAALHLSQRRLLRLSESGIVGLAYWDTTGRITDGNEAFLKLVGHTREELKSGTVKIETLVPPEWISTTRAMLEEVRTNGVSAHHEKQFQRKNATRCDVMVAAARLEENTGLLFVLDISSRKRTEAERGRLFEELEEALRGRDEFLATATHDIRSPLGALHLKLQLVSQLAEQDSPDSHPELVRQVDGARNQVEHVVNLLGKLLDTTRGRFGQIVVHWEEMDLGALVAETTERMRAQFEAARCPLELEITPGVTGIWDRIRIEQIINNLLSNAINYGAGHPVVIAVSGDEKTARLEVRDQGPGIRPEDQARMFTAFERGTSGGAEGFGLGLWIVRRIVEALDGAIWVQSGSGQGATFTVTLPRKQTEDTGKT